MTATITSFIVNGDDFFAANLDNGSVRVGLVGYQAHDFAADHPMHSRVAACASESQAEEIFDECFAIYGPTIVII